MQSVVLIFKVYVVQIGGVHMLFGHMDAFHGFGHQLLPLL
jgi:hypothetical protein